MKKLKKDKFFIFSIIFCYLIVNILCANIEKINIDDSLSYGAKIFSKDGNLIIESAKDRNITFRLTGDSCLLINDINILDAIKNYGLITSRGEEDGQGQLSSPLLPSSMTEGFLLSQVLNLKDEIEKVETRISRIENRLVKLIK